MSTGRRSGQFGFPSIVTWGTGFLVVLCLLLVVSLLYAAEGVPDAYPVLRRILQSIAAIILTSGIISIASNLLVHKHLADFWLDALAIRESFQQAGLEQIGLDFQNFDFRKHVIESKNIDILVIYASTWLRHHINDLKEFLSGQGNQMRICILDESSSCVTSFAESFGMKGEDLQGKIRDSVNLLVSIVDDLKNAGRSGGQLMIFKHNRPPRHTYYRFDETLMLVPYNIARGRPRIPVFAFQRRSGGVSDFLQQDFENVLKDHAKLAYDSIKPAVPNGTKE